LFTLANAGDITTPAVGPRPKLEREGRGSTQITSHVD
jgi:hypothetical protein